MKLIHIAAAAIPLLSANNGHACEDCARDSVAVEKRVSWDKIEFRARKFVISASSVMEWSVLKTTSSGVEWIQPGGVSGVDGTPIPPGEEVLRIAYTAVFLGTHYHTVLWVDPETGAILQYETSKDGKKAKHRIYRFTNKGAFRRTWRPNDDEKKLDWREWTDQSGDYRSFQPEAHDQIVIDTLSLIYLVATSDLGRGINEQDYLAYGNREISRAVVSTTESVDINADFYMQGPIQEQRCQGKIKALKLNLEIQPVGELTDPDFGFLTEIELYLTPNTRIPFRISGRAKKLGKLVIKAKRVFTPEEFACPERSLD